MRTGYTYTAHSFNEQNVKRDAKTWGREGGINIGHRERAAGLPALLYSEVCRVVRTRVQSNSL